MDSRVRSLEDCFLAINLRTSLMFAVFTCVVTIGASAQTWNLTWSDEFNGTANSPINPQNWQYDNWNPERQQRGGVLLRSGSSTSPCDPANPNAYIDGSGHLVIQALPINSSAVPYRGSWTSARLNSANNLESFPYGRIESSMSLPLGPGLWPAWWALGTNITSVGR
jgi:beta-glucanase (GH16 family)